jgi:hypothetical protein
MPKRFKWRKPKPMKDQPSATHKDNERQEKPSDTHTVVTGGIKVDLVDDLREQHKTEYDKADTHNKKQLRWTKITAGLVFIYALLTLWQARSSQKLSETTQKQFEVTSRPYIGFNRILVTDRPDNKIIELTGHLKNFGSVPATDFVPDWQAYANGVRVSVGRADYSNPSILFPGENALLVGDISGDDYLKLMRGTMILDITIFAKYSGPISSYMYCNKERFLPEYKDFADRGPCDYQHEAQQNSSVAVGK